MSSDVDPFIIDFDSPCGEYRLSFDDDGKTGYAYMKHGGRIIGDVWIYNRCATPDEPEWRDRDKIPFANCRPHVGDDAQMTRDVFPEDVRVEWSRGELVTATIYVHGELAAVLAEGEMPGTSRRVAFNGPLGRVLDDTSQYRRRSVNRE